MNRIVEPSQFRLLPPEENRFYAFMALFIYVATRWYFRLEVVGTENIPLTGPVLLAANHASNLDPTTIACGLPRQVQFLAKEELLQKPLLGSFLRCVNTHPIRRGGGDRAAIRQCVELLRQGRMVLIFPEGTRTRDGRLQEGKPGAAMIALQAEAPICPVYIDGTFEAMPRSAKRPVRHKVRVLVGEPLDPVSAVAGYERRERYEALTRIIMERIAGLGEQALAMRRGETVASAQAAG